VGKFQGDPAKIDTFLQGLFSFFVINTGDIEDQGAVVRQLPFFLDGTARDWFYHYQTRTVGTAQAIVSYESFALALKLEFADPEIMEVSRRSMRDLITSRSKGLTYKQFSSKFRELSDKIPGRTAADLFSDFLAGCTDQWRALVITQPGLHTWTDVHLALLKHLNRMSDFQSTSGSTSAMEVNYVQQNRGWETAGGRGRGRGVQQQQFSGRGQQQQYGRGQQQQQLGRSYAAGTPAAPGLGALVRKCWNCGVAGHARNECRSQLINRGYDYAPQKKSTVFSILSQEMGTTEADEHWETEEDSMEWPGLAAPPTRPTSANSLP
jgi:hypothetical protein